jgi:hypothetical protein
MHNISYRGHLEVWYAHSGVFPTLGLKHNPRFCFLNCSCLESNSSRSGLISDQIGAQSGFSRSVVDQATASGWTLHWSNVNRGSIMLYNADKGRRKCLSHGWTSTYLGPAKCKEFVAMIDVLIRTFDRLEPCRVGSTSPAR